MTKSQIIAALVRAGWTRQAALEKARELVGPHGVGGFADEARVEAATGLRGFGHPVLSADPVQTGAYGDDPVVRPSR